MSTKWHKSIEAFSVDYFRLGQVKCKVKKAPQRLYPV